MMNRKKGRIFVIVSCSGTGKTTLIQRLRQDIPDLKWSVSCTTRPQRTGEVDKQDYYFMSNEEFIQRKENNEFIEWAVVHSNYYGTSKRFIESGLINGELLLFDIDIQGADAIKDYYKDDATIVFIAPPSLEELEKRLRGRGTDRDEVIRERLSNAQKELRKQNDYDHLVINDDLEIAYKELNNIIKSRI